jgi:hypothetical protein
MTSFDDFIEEIRTEAKAEGPEAVAEFAALESHYREAAGILEGIKAVQRGDTHELEIPPTFGPED